MTYSMNKNSWTRVVLILAAIAVAGLVKPTVQAIAADPADNPFAGNIANANAAAAGMAEEFTRLSDDVQGQDQNPALKEDMAKAKKFYDDLAASYAQAAAAWSEGDDARAQKVMKELEVALRGKDIWRTRMTELRRSQTNAAPTEQWYTDAMTATPEGARPALDKLSDAKTAEAAAWGAAAEAAEPGVDPRALDDLKEKAVLARIEMEISTWRWSWANQLEGAWADKSITPEEIQPQLAALQKAQDEAAAIRREQAELDRRLRHAFADLNKTQAEAVQAIWKTREAHARVAATQASVQEGK